MPNLEIMWTKVDEAPALATYSLLPIVKAFVGAAGVAVTLKDISLAGRILASVADLLPPAQRTNDELAELGDRCGECRGLGVEEVLQGAKIGLDGGAAGAGPGVVQQAQ